jgi:Arm DNA-binding domain
MARKLNKLTARQVATVKTPGRHSDGGGLYLAIGADRRAWVFRYALAGRVREMGLGSVSAITLAQARAVAQGLPFSTFGAREGRQ